ncbi:nucleotide sugar dehydrogenase [Halomicroarcula limicola]|uniref:UDP-N-acetyl-D-mannosamine dehydrogenase n=1 Tax=Haloarcula limicola TaxID=1429915 RepID=A0A8J7Y739_9EURY|nr:nucleotide sugar dehydrogenase [Halomicroarcula limicola]MBV0925472.1 nucleotide sugar dehydrogenase [Halomicroarcula limicola]
MSESVSHRTGEQSARPEGEQICVVGLGYVGMPLALAFDDEGFEVTGFDIDPELVETLSDGNDPTGEAGHDRVAESDVSFTAQPDNIVRADYVILTVPTPVDNTQNPNLDFVKGAARTVGEHISEDTTVILESTVYPGVTESELAPIIEEESGLTAGEEFNLGYSPERLSPGDGGKTLEEVVKIVSGDTDETLEDVATLYETVVDAGVYRAPSIQTAEAAKVIENVQRDINIALMNELAIICDHMDVDTHEVLDAAGTKWNFHDYRPGLVGGHCIPVDPLYLAHGSERAGYTPSLILQGREVNEYMPKHAAELTMRGLNEAGKVLKDSSVLVLGLSYKPNVGDIRTSEVDEVITELETYGIDVEGYDPHAQDDAMAEHFGIPIQDTPDFEGFDAVFLATPHDEFDRFDLSKVAGALNDDPVLIDVMADVDEADATEAGFIYDHL